MKSQLRLRNLCIRIDSLKLAEFLTETVTHIPTETVTDTQTETVTDIQTETVTLIPETVTKHYKCN